MPSRAPARRGLLAILVLTTGLTAAAGSSCGSVKTPDNGGSPTPTPTPSGTVTATPSPSPTASIPTGSASLKITATCTNVACPGTVNGRLWSIVRDAPGGACATSGAALVATCSGMIAMTQSTTATNLIMNIAGPGSICVDTFFDANANATADTGDLTASFFEATLDPVPASGQGTATVLLSHVK